MEFVDFLQHLVSKVPDVVWSGVIGSGLTLLGVFASNSSNTKRLEVQLNHDSKEKSKERAVLMRREVYLDFSVELIKANSHLASFPSKDITKENVSEGLQGMFQALARVQLVCEPATILLAVELNTMYGQAISRLTSALIPVSSAMTDRDLAKRFYDKYQAEIDRALAAQTAMRESGSIDQAVLKALQDSVAFNSEQSKKLNEEREEAAHRYVLEQMNWQRALVRELRTISPLQYQLMAAIRSELDVGGNPKQLQEGLDEQADRMEQALNDVFEELKLQMKEAGEVK